MLPLRIGEFIPAAPVVLAHQQAVDRQEGLGRVGAAVTLGPRLALCGGVDFPSVAALQEAMDAANAALSSRERLVAQQRDYVGWRQRQYFAVDATGRDWWFAHWNKR